MAPTNNEAEKYPECEKMAAIQPKSQAIGAFLEWLGSGEADKSGFERPIFLAAYRIVTETSRGELEEDEYYVSDHHIDPIPYTMENMLARFFGIDLEKVEREKRAMLEKIRTKQRQGGG
jgi:hypothetical protein